MTENKTTKKQLMNIMAVVNPFLATTAPQNLEQEASPFSNVSLKQFYDLVAKLNPGSKVVAMDMRKAIKIGYGNNNKAFYCPAAEGHIFFRSVTEGIIPVHRVLPPYLPETSDFQRRSAYGTFPYKSEVTLPAGNQIHMVHRDGIYYWLDYMRGKREGAYQLYWCAAEDKAFK